jgi:hypothetical protein
MPLAMPKILEETFMKTRLKRLMSGLSLTVAVTFLCAAAVAQCPGGPVPKAKLHRQAWQEGDAAQLLRAPAAADPIVGMWRVQLTDGTNIIDQAISQWHSDGTEVMNSSRNPETQSFCLGVWEKVGASTYKLNHYGISWDQGFSSTSPLGLANIRETVTVAKDGKSFSGTFILNQYDESGNTLATISGTITGFRVDVTTNIKVLF